MRKLIIALLTAVIITGCNQPSTSTNQPETNQANPPSPANTPTSTPSTSPTPTPFQTYQVPQVEPDESYTVILMGDSMTLALGRQPDSLRQYLNNYYPDKTFGLFNVSQASTNMETIPQLLHQPFEIEGQPVEPILDRYFDVIIIESFGYNPLSELPLEQGLQKQEQILNDAVTDIIESQPNAVIIFLATIAPNSNYYGLQTRDLSPTVRQQWVEERRAYIENHIQYAQQHHIPLINIYQETQTPSGQGLLRYINPDDYIHPSAKGVDLISTRIAEFIAQNNYLPQ